MQAAGAAFFSGGCDSNSNPSFLGPTQYLMGMNVVNRGGIVQTRPGYQSVLTLPPGNLQGFTTFKPNDGPVNLVAVVDGLVYVSPAPFDNFDVLTGIAFHRDAKFVVMKECLQTTDYDENGVPFFLNQPKRLLVMQDRRTRAAFWDGSEARHLNPQGAPTPITDSDTGELVPQPGFNETPIGLWMEFSGNRLWVARDNQVFASDYGNPLKFTEILYLAEGRAFYMPEPVTGMIQRNAGSPLLVFGESTNTILRSDILDRREWLNTADFQITDHSIGCIAGRSISQSYGQIWWYSKSGVTNLNSALQLNNDSRFRYWDEPMTFSKGNMSPIKDGICAVSYENYLLFSVPSGDTENKHTWVMDQSPVEGGAPAWNGFWTGVRPVEWAKALVNGDERVFCASRDTDGANRIWEAFTPDRTDCGCPITCWLMTKSESWENSNWKRLKYADLLVDEILGDVSLSVSYIGTTGAYKEILNKEIVATDGVFNPFNTDYNLESDIYGHRPQGRVLRTRTIEERGTECDSCGVEHDRKAFIDKEFGLLILWSGRMGVKSYRMWATDERDQEFYGECEKNEEGFNSVSQEGCASKNSVVSQRAFPVYTAVKTVTIGCPNPDAGTQTNTAMAMSRISQADADRKAECLAIQRAESQITCFIPDVLVNEEGSILTTENGDILTT